jgi:hypothetical protein
MYCSVTGAVLFALAGTLLFSTSVDAQNRRTPAVAQSPADDAAFKAAFEETLRKPNDPAVLMRYAELAVKIGDLEAAISALERLLLIDADQPRVNLELGVLYYRLGSYEAARGYLKSARGSAKATPEIPARAEQVLADVDDKTHKADWSGELLFGLRYSTNANSGPSGGIRSFGATTVPSPNISGRPDFNVLGAAAIRNRYDLGTQDNATLETDMSYYGSRQFQVSEANVQLAELTSGPRSRPFDGWADDVSIKPFVTGRYLAVQNYTTYWAWGSGMEITSPISANSLVALTMLARRREFINNPDVPNNSNSSGNEIAPALEFRADLSPALSVNFSTNVTRYIAMIASESYTEFGANASLAWRFVDPLGINGRNWIATWNAGIARAAYDAPDPSVDPSIPRQQNDLFLGFTLGVPLDERLTLVTQAAYARRDSDLSNYAYEAFTVLTAVSWRF